MHKIDKHVAPTSYDPSIMLVLGQSGKKQRKKQVVYVTIYLFDGDASQIQRRGNQGTQPDPLQLCVTHHAAADEPGGVHGNDLP